MTWKTTKAKYGEHNNLVHCTGALGHFLKVFFTRTTQVDINGGTN